MPTSNRNKSLQISCDNTQVDSSELTLFFNDMLFSGLKNIFLSEDPIFSSFLKECFVSLEGDTVCQKAVMRQLKTFWFLSVKRKK